MNLKKTSYRWFLKIFSQMNNTEVADLKRSIVDGVMSLKLTLPIMKLWTGNMH